MMSVGAGFLYLCVSGTVIPSWVFVLVPVLILVLIPPSMATLPCGFFSLILPMGREEWSVVENCSHHPVDILEVEDPPFGLVWVFHE
jgi:hypothetical protein